MTDHALAASWAAEPLFYEAPHPPQVEPRPYQHAGVEYCLARDHALLGDAPGLGKSAEAIMVGNAIGAERTLVVCPASLRFNWEREVWLWSTTENVRTYPVTKASDGVSPDHHYVITSYDLLRNRAILDAILALRWDHLIMDEAHYLKDPRGNARTRAVCGWWELARGKTREHPGVVDACGRITLASGTILPNQPVECYNAVRMLCWDAIDGMSLEDFREHYYEMGEGFVTRRVWDPAEGRYTARTQWGTSRNVPRNISELRGRLRRRVMVRRLKEHVMTQLPEKQWHVFPLGMTPGIRKALNHPSVRAASKLWELNPDDFSEAVPIDGAISTARRVLGEEKAPEVAKYVLELAAEGCRKIVVGAWHHSVLDVLREKLAPLGLVYMDGGTTPKAKQRAVDAFQEDDEVGVILGQMLPLGEGWTLTAAQDVVLPEPYWVPGKNDQLFDRIHRIGQEGAHVICHVPVVPNSLDERVLNSVIRKDQVIHETLDVGRPA